MVKERISPCILTVGKRADKDLVFRGEGERPLGILRVTGFKRAINERTRSLQERRSHFFPMHLCPFLLLFGRHLVIKLKKGRLASEWSMSSFSAHRGRAGREAGGVVIEAQLRLVVHVARAGIEAGNRRSACVCDRVDEVMKRCQA